MRPGGLHNRNPDHYNGVDPLEMSFLRITFNACTTFLILKFKYKKSILEFPVHLRKTIITRSMCGLFGFVFMTYGVSYLPATIFYMIQNTSVFFVSILSYFILNEKLMIR